MPLSQKIFQTLSAYIDEECDFEEFNLLLDLLNADINAMLQLSDLRVLDSHLRIVGKAL